MKEWLTLREIAEERLPELPATKMGMGLFAERHGWDTAGALARPRKGREGGGGTEYHIRLFPTLARIAYCRKHQIVGSAPPGAEVAGTEIAAATETSARATLERDARLAIVSAYRQFSEGSPLGKSSRIQVFTDRYNLGAVTVEKWVAETVPSFRKRSLVRWLEMQAKGKALQLGHDPAASRKGTGILETANGGAVRTFILGVLFNKRHADADSVRNQCEAEFGREIADRHGVMRPLPPLRTFQHFLKGLKVAEEVVLLKVTNPDGFRSHFAMSGTGAFSYVTEPNQLWQVDASPIDVMCVDGRHSIYLCLDIATRRIVITTSKTPRASAVNLMTRKAILAWGAPRAVKTDNGSDFVATEAEGLFRAIDIEIQLSTKYTPQEKGHVERAIKTFQHDFGEEMPGFIGHDVADRKKIELRKAFAQRLGCPDEDAFCVELTAAELQAYIDRWVAIYENEPHEGLGKKTPADVAMASGAPKRTVDERALDVLLMPLAGRGGIRTMTKRGLKVDHHYYQAPEIMPRTRVFVRLDPLDAGLVRAFSADRREFLAVAVCYGLSGVNPVGRLKADKAKRAAMIKAVTDPAIAATKHLTGREWAERNFAVREARIAERKAGAANVIPMPRREEAHSTPEIAAAIAAFEAPLKGPKKAEFSDADRRRYDRLVADFSNPAASPKVTPLRREETPHQRFARMIAVERRRDAGEPLTEDEAYDLGSYQGSSEYKTFKKALESFGDKALGLRT